MIPAPLHSVNKGYSKFGKKKAMKNFNYCCTRLKQLLIFLFFSCKHLNKRQMNKVSGRKFFFHKVNVVQNANSAWAETEQKKCFSVLKFKVRVYDFAYFWIKYQPLMTFLVTIPILNSNSITITNVKIIYCIRGVYSIMHHEKYF